MKNLVWLAVVLLGQRLSAMPAHNNDILLSGTLPISQPFSYSKTDTGRQGRYTDNMVTSLHFNSLAIKATEKGTLLNWDVKETVNLQYFLIEQAVDGQNFSPLFEVPVQLHQHNYSFVDNRSEVLGRTIFYRVKAVYPTAVIASTVQKRMALSN